METVESAVMGEVSTIRPRSVVTSALVASSTSHMLRLSPAPLGVSEDASVSSPAVSPQFAQLFWEMQRLIRAQATTSTPFGTFSTCSSLQHGRLLWCSRATCSSCQLAPSYPSTCSSVTSPCIRTDASGSFRTTLLWATHAATWMHCIAMPTSGRPINGYSS